MNELVNDTKMNGRRGEVPNYEYHTLGEIKKLSSDARNMKKTYNIFGVVIDSVPVQKSKGSDYFSTLRLVDPSYCKGEGLKVALFHREAEKLPKVEQWDIIRLHRVKSSTYENQMSLISTHGWSWITWNGKRNGPDSNSFKAASKTFTLEDYDGKHVEELRDWIEKQGFMELDLVQNKEGSDHDQKIKDVVPGSYFNLVCQVTGMAKVRDDFICLKVWDGTIPTHRIESPDCEGIVMETRPWIEKIGHYMLDVSIFDNHVHSVEEDEIYSGSFVRIRNLHSSEKRSIVQEDGTSIACSALFLHAGTNFNRGIVTLDDDSDCVAELKELMALELQKMETPDDNNVNQEANSLIDTCNNLTLDHETDILSYNVKDLEASVDFVMKDSTTSKRASSPELDCPKPSALKRKKLNSEDNESSSASEIYVTPPEYRSSSRHLLKNSRSTRLDLPPISASLDEVEFIIEENPEDTLRMLSSMEKCSENRNVNSVSRRTVSTSVNESILGQRPQVLQKHVSTFVNKHMLDCADSNNECGDHQPSPTKTTGSLNVDSQPDDALRCHQQSATVVFGDNSPLKITSIKELQATKVPVRQSKLFRVRVKIFHSSNINKFVYYHCPATGLHIPANNGGKRLKIPTDTHEYLKLWRQCRGLDTVDSGDLESVEPVIPEEIDSTLWNIPSTDSTNSSDTTCKKIKVVKRPCVEDGSDWEHMMMDDDSFVRKREGNGKKFTIVYHKDPQCLSNLSDLSKKCSADRVMRITTKDAITSQSLPPIAYQNGIYYYCSPGCVENVLVPTLAEELKNFDPEKPLWALGCPVLLLKYNVKLLLEDSSDAMEVVLKGNSAVDFFNGITPPQFLTNADGCADVVAEHMLRIVADSSEKEDGPWLEMVIEKKSRRSPHGSDPVFLYEVINTSLRQW